MARTWTPISEPTSSPPKRWISSTEKRGQRGSAPCRPARARGNDEAEDDVRGDAGCAGRVPIAGLELTCMHALLRRATSRRSRAPRRPATRIVRDSARLSHSGPRSPNRKAAFAATSAEAGCARRGHLLPARLARLTGRRIDEVRAARRRATRRETARDHADGATGRKRDVDRTAHSDVPADRHKPRLPGVAAASSTASALATPFRSARAQRTREQPSRDGDLRPAAAERRLDRPSVSRRRRAQLQRAREEPRNGDNQRRRGVDAGELRLRPEEAERVLPALEDLGHPRRITARKGDVAAHRAEPLHRRGAHDVEETTGGG
jgi:hypothetical protein